MNTKQALSAALLALGATSVFAGYAAAPTAPVSTVTRAEVKADLARARADRNFDALRNEAGIPLPIAAAPRDRAAEAATRARVQAELARARADGTLDERNDLIEWQAPIQGGRSRAEVREETRQYFQAHPYSDFERSSYGS